MCGGGPVAACSIDRTAVRGAGPAGRQKFAPPPAARAAERASRPAAGGSNYRTAVRGAMAIQGGKKEARTARYVAAPHRLCNEINAITTPTTKQITLRSPTNTMPAKAPPNAPKSPTDADAIAAIPTIGARKPKTAPTTISPIPAQNALTPNGCAQKTSQYNPTESDTPTKSLSSGRRRHAA